MKPHHVKACERNTNGKEKVQGMSYFRYVVRHNNSAYTDFRHLANIHVQTLLLLFSAFYFDKVTYYDNNRYRQTIIISPSSSIISVSIHKL